MKVPTASPLIYLLPKRVNELAYTDFLHQSLYFVSFYSCYTFLLHLTHFLLSTGVSSIHGNNGVSTECGFTYLTRLLLRNGVSDVHGDNESVRPCPCVSLELNVPFAYHHVLLRVLARTPCVLIFTAPTERPVCVCLLDLRTREHSRWILACALVVDEHRGWTQHSRLHWTNLG
jgi:hypothetical protein